MKHAAVHGPVHHHDLHQLVGGAGKVIHRPEFWIVVAIVAMIGVVLTLTLIYGAGPQPGGWDSYLLMPY